MKIPVLLLSILFLNSCGDSRKHGESEEINSQKENFHIYLLMGQSNMAGRGLVAPMDTVTHPRVLMLSKEDSWVHAKNPVHFDKPIAGTGLGLTFGKIMAKENNDIMIGLVPCAKGGSSINQWFPDSIHQATNSYPYNEMIAKSKMAFTVGTLKGILWHQGEADTNSEIDISSYRGKFNEMINLLKTDLGIRSVPVVIGELGYFFSESRPLAEEMNRIFERMAAKSDCIKLVSADNLTHNGDSVHFDSNSYRTLGERYAAKMKELQLHCTTITE